VQYSRLLGLVVPFVAFTLSAVAINGCGPTPTAPENGAPYSQRDLQLGTGADAVSGKTITADYTGWLYDSSKADKRGLQFETSVGGTPLSFTLGGGQVIEGIDQGVNGMKVGGIRQIVIPSSLGYGSVRNGPIPPFSTIVFEVQLLDVQ
jgi:FKBP-type peptidyl-prolyl cis-trans isomerase FkpA